MRSISIILTLLLTAAWAYTSWYWYTCNIKWLCDSNNVKYVSEVDTTENKMITGKDVIVDQPVTQDLDTNIQESEEVNAEEITVEKESAELPIEEETSEWIENTWEPQVWDENTPETEKAEDNVTAEKTSDEETTEEETPEDSASESKESNASLCDNPLTGPIALWASNDKNEVVKLEEFLKAQGKDITVNGVFESSDVELVKEFQWEYKAEILDPWGIIAPTWYVWTTTVKQINKISCE